MFHQHINWCVLPKDGIIMLNISELSDVVYGKCIYLAR